MRKVIFTFSIYWIFFNQGFAIEKNNEKRDSLQYTVEYLTGPNVKFHDDGFLFSASLTANLNASYTFSGIEITGGYIFSPILYASIGFGCSTNYRESYYSPLFVEGQVNLLQGRIVPYAGLQIGGCFEYSIHKKKNSAEFFFSPAIGLRYVFWKTFICFISVGYRFQSDTQYFYFNQYYDQIKIKKPSPLHDLSLKLGVYF